jgi:hypothetical protein
MNPTVTGNVTAYSVSPALPAGLTLSTTTGQVAGTPTVVAASVPYTITASNSAGSTSFGLMLTVLAPPSTLSYGASSVRAVQKAAMTPLSPTYTGTVDSFSVSPALPQGVALSTTSGTLSGTPALLSRSINYVITATNIAGSATFALAMSVERVRTTTDQADTAASPYQVHLIYAVPTDREDRRLDLDGTIEFSVRSALVWMTGATTGAQRLRVDEAADGLFDVTYFPLSRNDAFYSSQGLLALNAMAAEIQVTALYYSNKLFYIYYEGGSPVACGGGMLGGHFSAMYLHGTPPGFAPCDTTAFAISPTAPARYPEFVFPHEILHNLTFVQPCATHYAAFSPNHTGDDPNDLMWARISATDTRGWTPTSIDPGNDDYYGASVPVGCSLNLFNSAFLEPNHGNQLPAGF